MPVSFTAGTRRPSLALLLRCESVAHRTTLLIIIAFPVGTVRARDVARQHRVGLPVAVRSRPTFWRRVSLAVLLYRLELADIFGSGGGHLVRLTQKIFVADVSAASRPMPTTLVLVRTRLHDSAGLLTV